MLLLLAAYLLATRADRRAESHGAPRGLCAIAIDRASLRAFQELGFAAHPFVHTRPRWLVHARLGDISLGQCAEALGVDDAHLGVCYRESHTAPRRIVARC